MTRAATPQVTQAEVWPGKAYPLGATYDGTGTNFAVFSEAAETVELCLFDADGGETGTRCPRSTGSSGMGSSPTSSPASATATGCTARTTRPAGSDATPTSCCSTRTPRPSTAPSSGTSRCSATTSAIRTAATTTTRRRACPSRVVINPYFDWGIDRPPRHEYADTVIYEAHVKGLTKTHPEIPEADPRHVRRGRTSGDHRASEGVGCQRNRADAGAPLRQRLDADRQGVDQLLGLQHHRIPGAGRQIQLQPQPRRAGAGVQGHGARPARGRHRGDPRRRLQPHRRGQPHGPDAVDARDRQRRVLPAGRRRQALLHGLHRHRQQPQRRPPAYAAADHGLAAVLGDRDARRRVPVRPGVHAGPRVLRRRPAVGVLRTRATGSDGQPGQADRRTVGRRPRRLPGRQLPAAVDRVERQVPRHRARLLARRGGDPRRVRLPADRLGRPLRAHRPAPGRLDQLRHRPRRVHAAGSGVLQREAQRGQRRGQPRRGEPQPVVELRRGGPDRRHRRSTRCAAVSNATS